MSHIKIKFMKKTIASLLLLLSSPAILSQDVAATTSVDNSAGGMFTVTSKYMVESGILLYDRMDTSGNLIERVEKFFATPPIAECNDTTFGVIQ